MSQLLVLALVFLGTVGLLVGAFVFVNRRSLTAGDTALARLRGADRSIVSRSARSILRDENVSDLPWFDRLLTGRGLTTLLTNDLLSAGLTMTPGNFLLRVGVSALSGDRKSTRLNSSHIQKSRMPSSA